MIIKERCWREVVAGMLLFVLSNIFLSHAFGQKSKDYSVLERLPSINGLSYRCDDMAVVMNYLRELGKTRTLQLLREYNTLTKGSFNAELILLCHCIFINPKGWDYNLFGRMVPPVNGAVADEYECFPIVYSDGIPFLLIRGYNLGGRIEALSDCLEVCENLTFRESPSVPRVGYKEAAQKLISSKEFHQLFLTTEAEKDIARLLLMQTCVEEEKSKMH